MLITVRGKMIFKKKPPSTTASHRFLPLRPCDNNVVLAFEKL